MSRRDRVCNKFIVLIICCLVSAQARNGVRKTEAHRCKTSEVSFCKVEEACYTNSRMTRSEVREFYAAQYEERARRDPSLPEQNGPLMMKCLCKCGCREERPELKVCSTCNRPTCYANCSIYWQCHWCLRYPEDIPQHCQACGKDYPRSDERCLRCEAFLCVVCFRHDTRGLCTRCNNWLTSEINSAERRTECLICYAELDEESLDRCLKCHAAKCRDCDIHYTFCIKCDFMRPDWAQMFIVKESKRYYGRCPDWSKSIEDCWEHERLKATATNTRKYFM